MTVTSWTTRWGTTLLAGLSILGIEAAQAGSNGQRPGGGVASSSPMRMDFRRIGIPNAKRALSLQDRRVVPLDASSKTGKTGIIMPPVTPKDKNKGAAQKAVTGAPAAKRIGTSNPKRVLSPQDLRIVPLDASSKTGKTGIVMPPVTPKDDKNKSAAKQSGSDAPLLNPNSSIGEKGKKQVGNRPDINIRAAIAELFRLTGGNLAFENFAERVKLGPLVAANALFPVPGDGGFAPPGPLGSDWKKPEQRPSPSGKDFLNPKGSSGRGTSGGPDTSKTGWAGKWTVVSQRQGDGYRETSYRDEATGRYATVKHTWGGGITERESTVSGTESATGNDWMVRTSHTTYSDSSRKKSVQAIDVVRGENENEVAVVVTITNTTWDKDGKESDHRSETYVDSPPKPEDSQPADEGYGGRPVEGWCSPTGHCFRPARDNGRARYIPREGTGTGTTTGRRSSPSWATDPPVDGIGHSGNQQPRRNGMISDGPDFGPEDGPH